MKARCAVQAVLLGGLSMVTAMIANGCAVTRHSPHLSENDRSRIRNIAVVPAAYAPREDFFVPKKEVQPSGSSVLSRTAEEKTTGSGDPKVDEAWKQVAEAAWSEGWQMPVGAGITTAVLVNPLLGAFTSLATYAPIGLRMPADEQAKTEADIAQAYIRQDVQRNAAQRIVDTGKRLTGLEFQLAAERGPVSDKERPDYRPLGAAGADTALEVSLRDIGFIAGSDPDPLAALFMLADIRAVKVADGTILYTDTTTYVSRKRKLSEWLGGGAQALRTAIENGHAEMAEWMVEKVFLVQEFSSPSMWSPSNYCMFSIYAPETPGLRFGLTPSLNTPKIKTRQPLFQWEVFPRESDRKADPAGLLGKITNITYDLKIWKAQDGYPQEVVEEKTGFSPVLKTIETRVIDTSQPAGGAGAYKTVPVAVAEYGLEKQLEPSTVYFWSIRARFKLDGQTRFTQWAHSRLPFPPSIPDPCKSDHIDVMHYYRFETPGQ